MRTENANMLFRFLCTGGLAFCCTGFYGLSITNPEEQANALSPTHTLKIPGLVLLSSLAIIAAGCGIKKCFRSIGEGIATIGAVGLSASVGWFVGIVGFMALGVYVMQNQNPNSVSANAFLGSILGMETLIFALLMLKGFDIQNNTYAVTNSAQQANLLTPVRRPRSPALLAAPPSTPALPSSPIAHTSIEMMPRTETRFTAVLN